MSDEQPSALLLSIGSVCGVVYSVAWAIWMYPQIWKNYKRKSLEGVSLETVLIIALGLSFYSPYVLTSFLTQVIKGYPMIVPFSDVLFALSCLSCSLVILYQSLIYPIGQQGLSWYSKILISVMLLGAAVNFTFAFIGKIPWTLYSDWPEDGSEVDPANPPPLPKYNFLSNLAYLKLLTNLTNMAPQVYTNYKLKNTDGIELAQYFLNLTGCIFSISELLLTCVAHNDWSYATGNIAKPVISLANLLYMIVLLTQCLVIYPQPKGKKTSDANEQLESDSKNIAELEEPMLIAT